MAAIMQKLARITKEQSRDGGMALVLLLLLIYASYHWKAMLLAAIVLHVLNMTAPKVFQPFAFVWLGLSEAIGAVVSKMLMLIVFFVIVVPVGMIRRLAGKDALGLQTFRAGDGSTMVVRDHLFVASDLERPY